MQTTETVVGTRAAANSVTSVAAGSSVTAPAMHAAIVAAPAFAHVTWRGAVGTARQHKHYQGSPPRGAVPV